MVVDVEKVAQKLRVQSNNLSDLAGILAGPNRVDFDEKILSAIVEHARIANERAIELLDSIFVFEDVKSSNLNEVAHNTRTSKLRLTFKEGGTTYEYDDVPRSVYESLRNAESKGKFFHASIKGKYNYRKVEG